MEGTGAGPGGTGRFDMDRLACVDIPELPLQLLLRRQPQWHRYAVAVVDRDKPQGRILWLNESARRRGILPGMRYAAALSLSSDLRAAEVSPGEIEHAVESVTRLLQEFTPGIEAMGFLTPSP